MSRNFRELLEGKWNEGKFLCVGLDSELEKIPESAQKGSNRETLVAFNRAIIDATKDLVCAYKPNSAFYEAHGDEGFSALRETAQYILEHAPDVPIILDAKRADIGNTNNGYVDAIFGHLQMDAVTVQPYLGSEALKPFLEQKDKGIIVLCRTSNEGAGELQDLLIEGEPLYKKVAHLVAEKWNTNGNCAVVVGATYPEEMTYLRTLMPHCIFLIPGYGSQGGTAADVKRGFLPDGTGAIVNASRSIIFASKGKDWLEAAKKAAEDMAKEL